MDLSCRIISLENAAEFPIFCHTLSEAVNNNGDKESPWNFPLLMDTSPSYMLLVVCFRTLSFPSLAI